MNSTKKRAILQLSSGDETRRSAIAKSTARPSCLVGVLYDNYRRQTTDQQLINHLYETGHETYRIPQNNAK